jgi:hypothetical protein
LRVKRSQAVIDVSAMSEIRHDDAIDTTTVLRQDAATH